MNVLTGSRHPGDEDLIRYIDHQLDRDAVRTMGAHLRTCDHCTGRLDGMQQKSAMVSEWLSLLPAELPDPNKRAVALAALDRARFRRSGGVSGAAWLKIAAAILLLVALGLSTEPGRALVASGIVRLSGRDPGPVATRLVEILGQERQLRPATLVAATASATATATATAAGAQAADAAAPAAAHSAPPRVKPGTSAPLRFTPAGPEVTLTFSAVQRDGVATVSIRDARNADVQAVTHYAGEELVATPTGLEVHNRPTSRADYMITVPTRYRMIRVRVGGGPEVPIQVTKSKQDWIWTIDLRTSAVQ